MDERERELREALDQMNQYAEENHRHMEAIWRELDIINEQRAIDRGDWSSYVPFRQTLADTILLVN